MYFEDSQRNSPYFLSFLLTAPMFHRVVHKSRIRYGIEQSSVLVGWCGFEFVYKLFNFLDFEEIMDMIFLSIIRGLIPRGNQPYWV